MRTVVTIAIFGILASYLSGPLPVLARPKPLPLATDAKPTDAVKSVVTNFFKNWEQGKATQSLPLFMSADMPTVGIGPDHRPERPTATWQKKAGELLKEWESNPPSFLALDSVDVDPIIGSMAVARVTYRGAALKGYAVFTLHSDAGAWRIAALVFETHFVW